MIITQSKAAPTLFNSSLNQTISIELNAYFIYLDIISINLEGDILFEISREDYNILLINIPDLDISKRLIILEFILRESVISELLCLIMIIPDISIIKDLSVILPLSDIILLVSSLKPSKINNKIFKYKLKLFNKITIFSKNPIISKTFTKIV